VAIDALALMWSRPCPIWLAPSVIRMCVGQHCDRIALSDNRSRLSPTTSSWPTKRPLRPPVGDGVEGVYDRRRRHLRMWNDRPRLLRDAADSGGTSRFTRPLDSPRFPTLEVLAANSLRRSRFTRGVICDTEVLEPAPSSSRNRRTAPPPSGLPVAADRLDRLQHHGDRYCDVVGIECALGRER
jgi:hypothetical protein